MTCLTCPTCSNEWPTVPVGAPPLRAIRTAADRRRVERPAGTGDPAPAGIRLVGFGRSAIAVPAGWATNALRCGSPTRPTVVVDVTSIETCGWQSPRPIDAVWIEAGVNRAMVTPATDLEIDGEVAQRDATTCSGASGHRVCRGTVYLPSTDVSYLAQAATRARVTELLSGIRLVEGRVAVPGYHAANDEHQGDDAGEHYRSALAAAGLGVEVATEVRPGLPAG